MPRARNPNRDKAYELWVASKYKIKLKDIAAQLGETESTIRKWKCTDKWEQKAKGTLPKRKESAPKETGTSKEGQSKKKCGAPPGNKNAFKHGGYSAAYFDTLDEDEKAMIESMPQSEEDLLLDQIKLYTVNERRLLQAIKTVRDSKTSSKNNDTIVNYSNVSETYLSEDKKISSKNVNFEHIDNRLMRLQAELTKIQRAKNKSLDSLSRLHLEKEKLEMLKDDNEVEIEDTSDIEGVIYG